MKKMFLLLSFTCVIASVSYAQGGVYLYLPGTTTGTGTAGTHIDEAKLYSVQLGAGLGIDNQGNPSIPSVSEITVSKQFDLSSLRLHFLLLKPVGQTFAEVRFYNAQDAQAYSIRLERVFVSGASQSNGGDGCGTGCPGISESYSLGGFNKIIYRNFLSSPNQVLTYNIANNQCTLTQ